MGENKTTTVKAPSSRELTLALALGWAAAELVGRYRHGIHPRNPAAAKAWEGRQVPRLSYSRRALRSNNDLFWLLAQRMLVLSEELGLDDLESKDVEGSVDRRLRALPGEIRKYIHDPTSTGALEPEVFYQLLEDWTQLARLELGVRSRTLRDVFSFAGDLADVYWALPVPQRHNLPDWAGAWNKMLYKLSGVVRGLDRVKALLPPHVYGALRRSLEAWREARPARLAEEATFELAREISGLLGEQATIWGDILQGERSPEDYLRPRDRRAIGVLSLSAFVLTLVLILLTFFAVVVGGVESVIWVVVPFVRSFFRQVPDVSVWVKTPSVSDWLAIGGLVAAGGGLLVSAGVWLFRRLGDIYQWLWDGFTDLFVRRRTVVPWR